MRLLLLTLVVLGDLPPPPPDCRVAADCELSTFGGCCDCCPGSYVSSWKRRDGGIGCATECPSCEGAVCRPKVDVTQYVAACIDRHCRARLKNAECVESSDCGLTGVPSTDGGCAERVAMPRDAGVVFPKELSPCPGEVPPYATCTWEGRCTVRRWPAKRNPKKL